jgi:hypothetical protein
MSQNHHPQPRWWLLYLSLPLLGVLFWLIERAHPSDVARRSLEIGAVLIVFGYMKLWLMANTVALLHHPLGAREGEALYRLSVDTAPDDWDPVDGHRPAPAYTFYSDLFTGQVRSVDPLTVGIDEALTERLDVYDVPCPDR